MSNPTAPHRGDLWTSGPTRFPGVVDIRVIRALGLEESRIPAIKGFRSLGFRVQAVGGECFRDRSIFSG